MKKFLPLLLVVFFVFISPKDAFAQAVSPTPTSAVKYDLAYPGILPDSPIYKLKVLRDKIIEALISDPSKKIDFYLLQADKGMLASAILVDKNEIKLAEDTALKAENNFTLITGELGRLYVKPNPDLFTKLETASLKHQEVLSSLEGRVPQEDKKVFETVLNFSKSNLETVKKFQSKKYYYSQY